MAADANTSVSKPKFSFVEQGKKPRIALYDDQRKLWGYFFPEEARMLKSHSDAEWCALGRRLFEEHPSPSDKCTVILYADSKGLVRGTFYMVPGMGIYRPLYRKFTREERKAMRCDVEIPGESYTLDELRAKLDEENEFENDKL